MRETVFDDTEEVIRRRQQVYHDDTAPLLDFCRSRLVTVNAAGTVEEITDRLLHTVQTTMTARTEQDDDAAMSRPRGRTAWATRPRPWY